MPTPGSHAYDTQRARRRAEHDDQGTPDQGATVAANVELQSYGPSEHAASGGARARGPEGER